MDESQLGEQPLPDSLICNFSSTVVEYLELNQFQCGTPNHLNLSSSWLVSGILDLPF